MAASTGCNRNEAICTFLDCFIGEAVVDHVVHGDPAPIAHCIEQLGACAKRGNNHRDLPLFTSRHVGVDTVIGLVNDLVDGKRRGGLVWVFAIVLG